MQGPWSMLEGGRGARFWYGSQRFEGSGHRLYSCFKEGEKIIPRRSQWRRGGGGGGKGVVFIMEKLR